jgi:urease accessory protein
MSAMLLRLIAVLGFVLPTAAYAHTGVGDTHGLVHGFMHPLGGLDHILAMVAVGLFAAHLGGRALWLVPAAFVSMMAVAGGLGASGVSIPLVETGIAISVIFLGLIVAFEMKVPVVAAMVLVGFFAIFHGHAHGAELPEDTSGLAYGAGFMIATALLHVLGVGIGLLFGRAATVGGEKVLQLSGCAMSLAGVVILLQLI